MDIRVQLPLQEAENYKVQEKGKKSFSFPRIRYFYRISKFLARVLFFFEFSVIFIFFIKSDGSSIGESYLFICAAVLILLIIMKLLSRRKWGGWKYYIPTILTTAIWAVAAIFL